MTLDLINEVDDTEPKLSTIHKSERASKAEMLFAGHYLNIFGILLLLTGLVSYFKSSGASSGLLESMLGGALGVVLLVIGEYFFRNGLKQYSHPVLTGGFCLLFFTACSAHFRHDLMGQETLFALLLPLVVCSNASVFRYDSRMIGNVMLVVYFFTPLFVTFTFHKFSTIFFYLLAINLGSTIVAFHKKWDFQLLASSLGSYALYFAHFRTESALNSLLLLFVIYGLSLLANNILYFFRPVASDYNLVLSFVNPTVFATLSTVTIMELPNWARVTAYTGLAIVHGLIALIADDRRAETSNFLPLATSSLSLSLLFASAAISFVTYFSDSTTYFGLVTLLWFAFALVLLLTAFKLDRHSVVLSRFSYFGVLLAVAQVVYVLPSMAGSQSLQVVSLCLYTAYFLVMLAKRAGLSLEQSALFKVLGFGAAPLFIFAIDGMLSPAPAAVSFGLLAGLSLCLPLQADKLPEFRVVPHCFSAAALWYAVAPGWELGVESSIWPILASGLGIATHWALANFRKVPYLWVWVGAALIGTALLPVGESVSLTCLSLALCHLLLVFLGGKVKEGELLVYCSGFCTLLICRISVLDPALDIRALGMALLIIGLSSIVVYRGGRSLPWLDYVLQGVLVLKLGELGYHIYPLICLLLGGGLAVALSRHNAPRLALLVHSAVGFGVLFLPLRQSIAASILGLVLVSGSYFLSYFVAGSREVAPRVYNAIAGLGTFAFLKFSLCLHSGPSITLSWSILATALLAYSAKAGLIRNWNEVGQGLFDYSRFLFFLSFVKSVLMDANSFGAVDIRYFLPAFLLSATFLVSGHLFVEKREIRNYFVILGLLVSCFHLTLLSHSLYGDRLIFQPLLSGFWSLVGFLVVAVGVALAVKVYRLFGLTTLVGNTVKILVVDIHVLDSYSQVNTYLILGTLLMMTSFLYQRQKDRLCGVSLPAKTSAPVPL